MAEKFYTDGMTVEEIINLGDDVLRSLSKRDMSRALRTVSLAANKRINRLVNHAVMDNSTGTFVEKPGDKNAIALDALNKLNEESGGDMKFTTKGKTRNQMISELGRARDFMQLKTSTVGKAAEVRQAREMRAMGKTREQYLKDVEKAYKADYKAQYGGKKPTKAQIAEVTNRAFTEYKETEKEIWSRYRKWQEMSGHKGQFKGSDVVINEVANRTASGLNEQQTMAGAAKAYEAEYIRQQEEMLSFIEENEDYDMGANY